MPPPPLDSADSQASLPPKEAAILRALPDGRPRPGHYVIHGTLNQGGMGSILEATQSCLGRTVAMKVILGEVSENAMARFVEEARIAGQLEHPNIVPIHEFGIDHENRLFFTMKRIKGRSLQDALGGVRSRDPIALERYSFPELLNIFQKVCDAVGFAHSCGVIHRDLKPANVMLGDHGEVLVVDWGLAKKISDDEPGGSRAQPPPVTTGGETTRQGEVLGTPRYMSPEQSHGKALDHRSDIYSLGAILHTLLFLAPPFASPGDSGAAGVPERETVFWPGGRIPRSLQAVANKALGLDPARRYQSVAELKSDVSAYQAGFATRAENAGLWKQITLALKRNRREAALSGAAMVLLFGLAAVAFLKVAHERDVAARALSELRKAAPAFVAQARSQALAGRLEDALGRVDDALSLDPQNPEYLRTKANLLQSDLRFRDAAVVFRSIEGTLSEVARFNANLCETLASEEHQYGEVSKQSLVRLYEEMMKERRPTYELMPLARLLGRDRDLALGFWTERLKHLPCALDPPIEKRLSARPDGLLKLDLSATGILDLQPLQGMPVAELDLGACVGVSNLVPLASAPLTRLDLSHTSVSDLAPLLGSPVQDLVLRGAPVTNLSVLRGMPLRHLDVSQCLVGNLDELIQPLLESLFLEGCTVADLRPLAGAGLRSLRLDQAVVESGFDALTRCDALERLVLPRNWLRLPAEEIAAIRRLAHHPRLRRISEMLPSRGDPVLDDAAQFWQKWSEDLRWAEALLRSGGNPKITRLKDATWEVDMHDGPVSDISILNGARISRLDVSSTRVRDLSPLRGQPLRHLDLRNTLVEKLDPLTNMPLRQLFLFRTPVRDFAPLSALHDLELLDASDTALSDLSMLRAPRLSELRIGSTRVADLAPLEGLPLQRLHCDNIPAKTLAPLLKVPSLLWLIPPRHVEDVRLLRGMPNLARISYEWFPGSLPTLSASEFWEHPDVPDLKR